MSKLAAGNVIVLADHALAQRKRARHFWGTMGVVLRFEPRRLTQPDAPPHGSDGRRPSRKTAFETRAPRSR